MFTMSKSKDSEQRIVKFGRHSWAQLHQNKMFANRSVKAYFCTDFANMPAAAQLNAVNLQPAESQCASCLRPLFCPASNFGETTASMTHVRLKCRTMCLQSKSYSKSTYATQMQQESLHDKNKVTCCKYSSVVSYACMYSNYLTQGRWSVIGTLDVRSSTRTLSSRPHAAKHLVNIIEEVNAQTKR